MKRKYLSDIYFSILLKLLGLFMLFPQHAVAQKTITVGVANTYTLTENDGFPGNNYVTNFEIVPSGKIYIKDFFGNFHITGNNFIKQVKGLTNITNSTQIRLLPNHNLLLIRENGTVSIISNDTLLKTLDYPENSTTFLYSKDLFRFVPRDNYMDIYKFTIDKWVLVNTTLWNKTMQLNKSEPFWEKNNQIYLNCLMPNNIWDIYQFDTLGYQFKFIHSIAPIQNYLYRYLFNNNWQINQPLQQSFINFYTFRTGSTINTSVLKSHKIDTYFDFIDSRENAMAFNYQNGLHEYFTYDSTHILPNGFLFETKSKVNSIQKNSYYPYYIALTGTRPLKVFPYLKKYPYIFNKDNSNNIFTIVQDDIGSIWAGSYEHYLSCLYTSSTKEGSKIKVKEFGKQPYAFMNASINYHHKLYFVGETMLGGILQYDVNGNMRKIQPQTPNGFYLYYAPRSKTIWMPSAASPNNAVYTCSANEIDNPTISWQILDTAVGIKPIGFTTITEDSLQRIWMGHPHKGFAVYNQQTKKAITYDLFKKETPIGFISCVTDSKGTVFMGSDDKGLWYYNDYSKLPTPQNLHNIYHPLLNNTKRITAMAIYNNWLVLSCYNKICLLNLDSFYLKHKAIVRYLNPQESAFTSTTEQNTLLVSKVDSSIWFSTSDMLYQWDIKTWLQMPLYKVNVETFIQNDSSRLQLSANKTLQLQASINSFDIVFEYLSADCLPRYTRTALVKKGDSLLFTEPNLQSKFSYKNLSSGKYTFYVEVFEQDGSTSRYEYTFIINKYFWQKWWFWVLASFTILIPIILWLNSLRKEALQQKRISQLNIVTLSNQFRPHFILNVLNTIGADLKDKPSAETVISRLGESINLIFNHAKQQTIAHSLKNEWTLVKNVIDIHRVMYLPKVKVTTPQSDYLEQNFDMLVPMGIIEIFVENALLHGLRNRMNPPYYLDIVMNEDEKNTYISISDNGIGRKNASNISSYTKHGTGTKNIAEIIFVLNEYNKNKIEINYKDNYKDKIGTTVQILLPKNFTYEY